MLKIIAKQRKTNFLTPSGLRCLAGLPTVNITAGCSHGCVYCYTRGYSIYPGDNVIEIYEDMPRRIADEIDRKRIKPAAVYFCPSCDPFQSVDQIQQISFEVMKILLEQNIGVQFVTKGEIREDILGLLGKYANLVCGQFGITCVDDNIRQIVEPKTATVTKKLSQLKHLIDMGVAMCIRCDPLIYELTDGNDQLEQLFAETTKAGCREAAISYLFLRPGIIKSLRANIKNTKLLQRILEPYCHGEQLTVGLKNSRGTMLPINIRKARFERITQMAEKHGIKVHICGCKNNDITHEFCHIIRRPEEPKDLFV